MDRYKDSLQDSSVVRINYTKDIKSTDSKNYLCEQRAA